MEKWANYLTSPPSRTPAPTRPEASLEKPQPAIWRARARTQNERRAPAEVSSLLAVSPASGESQIRGAAGHSGPAPSGGGRGGWGVQSGTPPLRRLLAPCGADPRCLRSAGGHGPLSPLLPRGLSFSPWARTPHPGAPGAFSLHSGARLLLPPCTGGRPFSLPLLSFPQGLGSHSLLCFLRVPPPTALVLRPRLPPSKDRFASSSLWGACEFFLPPLPTEFALPGFTPPLIPCRGLGCPSPQAPNALKLSPTPRRTTQTSGSSAEPLVSPKPTPSSLCKRRLLLLPIILNVLLDGFLSPAPISFLPPNPMSLPVRYFQNSTVGPPASLTGTSSLHPCLLRSPLSVPLR